PPIAPSEIYTLSLHDALPISFLESSAISSKLFTMTILLLAGVAPSPLWKSIPQESANLTWEILSYCFFKKSRASGDTPSGFLSRSEEHTSELQSRENLVCRLL